MRVPGTEGVLSSSTNTIPWSVGEDTLSRSGFFLQRRLIAFMHRVLSEIGTTTSTRRLDQPRAVPLAGPGGI